MVQGLGNISLDHGVSECINDLRKIRVKVLMVTHVHPILSLGGIQ